MELTATIEAVQHQPTVVRETQIAKLDGAVNAALKQLPQNWCDDIVLADT